MSVTERADRYMVSVDEFSSYQRDGFVVVRDLVARSEVDELREHTEALMASELPEQREVPVIDDVEPDQHGHADEPAAHDGHRRAGVAHASAAPVVARALLLLLPQAHGFLLSEALA